VKKSSNLLVPVFINLESDFFCVNSKKLCTIVNKLSLANMCSQNVAYTTKQVLGTIYDIKLDVELIVPEYDTTGSPLCNISFQNFKFLYASLSENSHAS
jgi:hypothetical protein